MALTLSQRIKDAGLGDPSFCTDIEAVWLGVCSITEQQSDGGLEFWDVSVDGAEKPVITYSFNKAASVVRGALRKATAKA